MADEHPLGTALSAAGGAVASAVGGPVAGVGYTLGQGVLRTVRARWSDRRRRLAVIADLEQASGVTGLREDGLLVAMGDEHVPRLIDTDDSETAMSVVFPIVPVGATESDRRLVADAFVARLRRDADPVRNQIRDLQSALTDRGSTVASLADRGVAQDPRIATLLQRLDDPGQLTERDGLLAYLAHMTSDDDVGRYEAIVAPPFAGKSTLLAFFAAHPPVNTDVVAFFVSRASGRNTVSAALDLLNGQLLRLGADAGPEPADDQRRRYHFRRLWDQAVELTRQNGRRLVLIVDGLDEQDDAISQLLPPHLPDHVSVIIGCRPNPANYELDEGAAHPLADVFRDPITITATERVREIQRLATAELRSAFGLAGGAAPAESLPAHVLSVVGATRGADLDTIAGLVVAADLDDRKVPVVRDAVERVVRRSSLLTSTSPHGEEEWVLAHETFLEALETDHADRLAAIREAIPRWLDTLSRSGWPANTPRFALIDAPSYLGLDELANVVDHRFRNRVRDVDGTETRLLAALRAAVDQYLGSAVQYLGSADQSPPIDLGAHLAVTLHRIAIASALKDVSDDDIRQLVLDGRADDALVILEEVGPDRRGSALLAIAGAIPPDQAHKVLDALPADDSVERLVIEITIAGRSPAGHAVLVDALEWVELQGAPPMEERTAGPRRGALAPVGSGTGARQADPRVPVLAAVAASPSLPTELIDRLLRASEGTPREGSVIEALLRTHSSPPLVARAVKRAARLPEWASAPLVRLAISTVPDEGGLNSAMSESAGFAEELRTILANAVARSAVATESVLADLVEMVDHIPMAQRVPLLIAITRHDHTTSDTLTVVLERCEQLPIRSRADLLVAIVTSPRAEQRQIDLASEIAERIDATTAAAVAFAADHRLEHEPATEIAGTKPPGHDVADELNARAVAARRARLAGLLGADDAVPLDDAPDPDADPDRSSPAFDPLDAAASFDHAVNLVAHGRPTAAVTILDQLARTNPRYDWLEGLASLGDQLALEHIVDRLVASPRRPPQAIVALASRSELPESCRSALFAVATASHWTTRWKVINALAGTTTSESLLDTMLQHLATGDATGEIEKTAIAEFLEAVILSPAASPDTLRLVTASTEHLVPSHRAAILKVLAGSDASPTDVLRQMVENDLGRHHRLAAGPALATLARSGQDDPFVARTLASLDRIDDLALALTKANEPMRAALRRFYLSDVPSGRTGPATAPG